MPPQQGNCLFDFANDVLGFDAHSGELSREDVGTADTAQPPFGASG